MSESGIRVLGEPIYRLLQRFSFLNPNSANILPGFNQGLSISFGQFLPSGIQQLQALRVVSGFCILNCGDVLTDGEIIVRNMFLSISTVPDNNIIRVYQPSVLSGALGSAGPSLSVKDDEFILGNDIAEFGGVAGFPLQVQLVFDAQNNDAAAHGVGGTVQLIFELYDRETQPLNPTRGTGGGSGGASPGNGGGLQSAPACTGGLLLPGGETWCPTGAEALHP